MINRFDNGCTELLIRHEVSNRKHIPGESISDYYNDLYKYADQARGHISDQEFFYIFLRGLNVELQKQIISQNPQNALEALNYAKNLSDIMENEEISAIERIKNELEENGQASSIKINEGKIDFQTFINFVQDTVEALNHIRELIGAQNFDNISSNFDFDKYTRDWSFYENSGNSCSLNIVNSDMKHEIDIEEGNYFSKIERYIHQESFHPDGSEFLQNNMDGDIVENEVYSNDEWEDHNGDLCCESIEINCMHIENQNENEYEKILDVIKKYNESHSPVYKPHVFGPRKFSFTNSHHSSIDRTQKRHNKGNSTDRNWLWRKSKQKNDFRGRKCNFQDSRINPDQIYRNYGKKEIHKRENLNLKDSGSNYRSYIRKHRKMGTWPNFSKRGFYNFNNFRLRGKHWVENKAYRNQP